MVGPVGKVLEIDPVHSHEYQMYQMTRNDNQIEQRFGYLNRLLESGGTQGS